MRRFLRDTRAVAAVEAGFIAPVFFLLLLIILDNGWAMFQQGILDNAVRRASRGIMTGQNTSSAATFKTALQTDVGSLIPSSGLTYAVTEVPVATGANSPTFSSLTAVNPSAAGAFGNSFPANIPAGAAVLVQVSYARPYILNWLSQYSGVLVPSVTSTLAFEVEPHSP